MAVSVEEVKFLLQRSALHSDPQVLDPSPMTAKPTELSEFLARTPVLRCGGRLWQHWEMLLCGMNTKFGTFL